MANKINFAQAFELETLKSRGITNDEMLYKLKKGNVTSWVGRFGEVTFENLQNLFNKNESIFETIIKNGYRVEDLTEENLFTLVNLKFSLTNGVEYTFENNKFELLKGIDSKAKAVAAYIELIQGNKVLV